MRQAKTHGGGGPYQSGEWTQHKNEACESDHDRKPRRSTPAPPKPQQQHSQPDCAPCVSLHLNERKGHPRWAARLNILCCTAACHRAACHRAACRAPLVSSK
eukprot:6292582-Prymnesium_polylepis.1